MASLSHGNLVLLSPAAIKMSIHTAAASTATALCHLLLGIWPQSEWRQSVGESEFRPREWVGEQCAYALGFLWAQQTLNKRHIIYKKRLVTWFFHQTFTDVPNFLIFKHTIHVKPVCFSSLNALLTLETAADRQAYGQKHLLLTPLLKSLINTTLFFLIIFF